MSMRLLAGFIVAYPMNWWLVTYHLKHGMMTVRPAAAALPAHDHDTHARMDDAPHTVLSVHAKEAPRPPVPALLSFLALAAGVALAFLLRPL